MPGRVPGIHAFLAVKAWMAPNSGLPEFGKLVPQVG